MSDNDRWLLTEDLAERQGVTPSTVREWRSRGTGPRGTRFGRRVKYRLSDVIAWEKRVEAAEQLKREPVA